MNYLEKLAVADENRTKIEQIKKDSENKRKESIMDKLRTLANDVKEICDVTNDAIARGFIPKSDYTPSSIGQDKRIALFGWKCGIGNLYVGLYANRANCVRNGDVAVYADGFIWDSSASVDKFEEFYEKFDAFKKEFYSYIDGLIKEYI